MRDMKRHTSEKLKEQIISHPTESRRECLSRLLREMLAMMKKAGKENCHNREFQLWQQDNHPILLSGLKIAHQKLDYTHYNPVMRGNSGKAGRLFI